MAIYFVLFLFDFNGFEKLPTIWIYLFFKELDLLKGDDTVYKLVGPVLLKQDLIEAQQTVQKRIDYIQSETLDLTEQHLLIWFELN